MISHCLEVFARRRVSLMVEISSSLVPGPACVCCHGFPCPRLLPSGCSQVTVSIALQPAQAQLPEALVFWADTPWVCQILLTDTGTDLAQAGEATSTWPRGRSWNQHNPALGKVSPGQCRPCATLLGMKKALFLQQQRASTPGTIFRFFFLCCVLFCCYMSSFSWSDEGLDKTG